MVRKDLDSSQKELSDSRSSNETNIKELSDRDATLTTLRNRFEKNTEKHGEKDKISATLEAANKQLRDVNTTTNTEKTSAVYRWSEKNESLQRDQKERLSVQVGQLNERIIALSIIPCVEKRCCRRFSLFPSFHSLTIVAFLLLLKLIVGIIEEHVGINPNPPKLKYDKDRVHIFQRNVPMSEKLESLKTLINKPELHKPDIG